MPQIQVIAPLHVSEPAKLGFAPTLASAVILPISSIPLRRRCDITQT